jgi:hypothetical protein
MYFVPEGQYDRSQARSAWEASLKEPSRRVWYGRALLIPEVFLVGSAFRIDVRGDGPFAEHIDFFCFHVRNFVIPYCNDPIEVRTLARIRRTLRDGSFGVRLPGTSCLATIALSLRDKSHLPMGGLIKLALVGFTLGNACKVISPHKGRLDSGGGFSAPC